MVKAPDVTEKALPTIERCTAFRLPSPRPYWLSALTPLLAMHHAFQLVSNAP